MTTVELAEPRLETMVEDTHRLLQIMGFAHATVICRQVDAAPLLPRTVQIDISAGDSGKLLIGAHGASLAALQHLVRCVLRRQHGAVHIIVDVNGYRARREQGLQALAVAAARQACAAGQVVTLRPMTAADRRAIHTALADRADVTTESLGEEPHRRVVIRPKT